MANLHGSATILSSNFCCFLNPFGSRNFTPQSVNFVAMHGLSSSCRSHLGASLTCSAPETKRAFISVHDKTNLTFLGSQLHNLGYTIVSTEGTAGALEKAHVPVTRTEQEVCATLDSYVKKRDRKQPIDEHKSGPYEVVVVNSYPFINKVSSIVGVPFERGADLVNIDGILRIAMAYTMHKYAFVVVDPHDYHSLLAHLEGNLEDEKFREILALKVSQHVDALFSPIREWLGHNSKDERVSRVNGGDIAASAIQHHGKEMSPEHYMNLNAAWDCVSDFVDPTCVVVKHMNPCGIASRDDICEAFKLAVKADPLCSSYGGIIAFNVEVDEALALEIREFRSPGDGQKILYEAVVAPAFSQKGLEILCGISKGLRVFEVKKNKDEANELSVVDIQFRTVSEKCPTKMELDDIKFAWLCVKHRRSNDIVVAKNKCMVGVASLLPNLSSALRIAMFKAGDEAKGAILATDAFFPSGEAWKDVLNTACEGGVSAIVCPGGSIGDDDAIDICNKYGVSLCHFRH